MWISRKRYVDIVLVNIYTGFILGSSLIFAFCFIPIALSSKIMITTKA